MWKVFRSELQKVVSASLERCEVLSYTYCWFPNVTDANLRGTNGYMRKYIVG